MWASRSFARSPGTVGLLSSFCSSARVFAPRFFQTAPRGSALALCYHFAPSGCEEDFHLQAIEHARHTIKKALRRRSEGQCTSGLERTVIGRLSDLFRSIRTGHDCFRFRFTAIEFAHDIGANAPKGLLGGLGFLAFADFAFVRGADKAALNEHVRTLLDRRRDVFRQSRTEDANAVPLGFRGPLVLRVLPGSLRGDRKNGELRPVVVPRLALLRVCSNKSDYRH